MIKNFLLSLLTLISSCYQPIINQPQDSSPTNLRVIQVIDGDTVKLSNGKTLRYIGIDTPETKIKQNNRFINKPQPFALEAKEFNRKLVQGKNIEIKFDVVRTDQYGRLLGYCYTDEVFVNAKLVEEGYAVTYTYPPNVKYTDLFVKLQKQARENKKGMWGVYTTISHLDAAKHIGQIRTVKGKVVDTYKGKKNIFLNFGVNHKQDFTVVIYNNSLQEFRNKAIEPEIYYQGKTIEVTGRIRTYNGPQIIVSSPGEITIDSRE